MFRVRPRPGVPEHVQLRLKVAFLEPAAHHDQRIDP